MQEAVAERITKLGLVALTANQEKPLLSGCAARAAGAKPVQSGGTLVRCCQPDFRGVLTSQRKPFPFKSLV